MTERWTYQGDGWGATRGFRPDVPPLQPSGYAPVVAGAQLPINDVLPVTGTIRYVAVDGDDAQPGTDIGAPKASLQSAVDASAAGDAVVVRGGTYQLSSQRCSIGKAVEVRAYPGEVPVFDNTYEVSSWTAEGDLRWVPYTSLPAKKSAEGINLTVESFYPPATFSNGLPTGLAAERGFANVSGAASYSIPASQTEADASGARVITGIYPDQCWVDGQPLIQVFVKELVRPGCFYVSRVPSGSDPEPPQAVRLYVHADDAAGTVEVSRVVHDSQPYFLYVHGDNATVRGLRVRGHSSHRGFFALQTGTGVSGLTVEDVEFIDTASTAIKLYGDHDGAGTFGGTKLVKGTALRRVTVQGTGWMGMSAQYTDDTVVDACRFTNINRHSESDASPKSGAIKGTKNHRMHILGSIVEDCHDSHGVWLDQSNYDCIVAGSYFAGVSGAALFWEISHKILIVNNLMINRADSGITCRISGGSGARIVNNTIIGGAYQLYVIAELRGRMVGGRWLAEHTERYGSGDYSDDSGGYASSDLDKARGGAFAGVNLTPGMEWKGGADEVVNNILVGAGTNAGMYFRPKTASATVNVEANEVVPALLDGNLTQTASGFHGEVDVVSGRDGDVDRANLSVWRSALGADYYSYVSGKDASGASRTDPDYWVVRADGSPTDWLASAHASAPLPPADLGDYLIVDGHHYGCYVDQTA